MLSPVSGFARMLRAGLIGVWVTLGACVGHVCGHGQLPPFIALAPVAGAAGCVAWFLTDRRIHLGTAALLILVPRQWSTCWPAMWRVMGLSPHR